MVNLLGKVVNCFSTYLNYLSYGITNQDYDLLYDANLVLRNNITEEKYRQYFYNNLRCSNNINIVESSSVSDKKISWILSEDESLNGSFIWTEMDIISGLKTYTINTSVQSGYKFMYISVPENAKFTLYDELNNILFDSLVISNYEFEVTGSIQTSSGNLNTAFRKKNMFNTTRPIIFTLKFY